MPIFSAFKAGVELTVEPNANVVHRILKQRRCYEYEHTDRWSDERNDLKGRNETGEFRGEAEISERIYGG